MFPVVILAGGLATRLRPLTEKTPKSLIEVNGEPFIAHQLRALREQGIPEVVLCLGFLGERVQQFVDNGEKFGVQVKYSFDGSTLAGTGGAIRRASSLLPEAFFVLYGDSYLPCNFEKVQAHFMSAGKAGLMTVFENHGKWDTSNVEFADGRILSYDKKVRTPRMRHIDYGLGVFQRQVFSGFPEQGAFDLASVYQDLLVRDDLTAFEVRERFYEIGSFGGIQELSEFLRRPR